jgi:hypothetical protein
MTSNLESICEPCVLQVYSDEHELCSTKTAGIRLR